MRKWYKIKILLTVVLVIIIACVSFDFIDPMYPTEEIINAKVTQSVQMFPKHRESYLRVIVELPNKSLQTLEFPLGRKIKIGDDVTLRLYKRKITRFSDYRR